MEHKRSAIAARKRLNPIARWGRYMLAGALLLAVLVASGIAVQLFATSDTLHGSSLEDADPTLYVHGDRLRPLVEETDGAPVLNIYGPGGRIIGQVARDGSGGQEVRHLLADHLGSTRAGLDSEGNVVAQFEYGPHGETATSGAAAGVRYRYTGHPYDESQGLYQTPARGYDPATGRFLSVDPQRQDGSPYVYAGNNPVLYKDQTGKGRTGTVVTPKIFKLAGKLVEKTSAYESNSRLLRRINDPKVRAWFVTFETLYDIAPELYHDFVHRVIHLNDFQEDNMEALGYRFSDLEGAVPQLPRTDVERRVKIMSNMNEYYRGALRYVEGERHRDRVIRRNFKGNKEAFFKSKRAMDSLLVTPKNERPDPDARKGYGNCGMVSKCIAGQIARKDRKVNVEVIEADPNVDHTFVVVGRDPRTDVSKPMTWNESALIVDGWLGFTEQANSVYAEGRYPEFFNTSLEPSITFRFE